MSPAIQRAAAERGQVLIFAAISMVMLFGMAAFAIDISQAVYTRRALQASSDAAALAGAQLLPDEAAARATAIAYSGVVGRKERARESCAGDHGHRVPADEMPLEHGHSLQPLECHRRATAVHRDHLPRAGAGGQLVDGLRDRHGDHEGRRPEPARRHYHPGYHGIDE